MGCVKARRGGQENGPKTEVDGEPSATHLPRARLSGDWISFLVQ